MGGRMILAAIVGGLVLILWGAPAHMALRLGDSSIRDLPGGGEPVAALLKQSVPARGLYALPAHEAAVRGEPGAMEELERRMEAGPYALLVVDPAGAEMMNARMLLDELGTSIAMSMIAVFLVVAAGGLSGATARIAFCVLLALFGLFQTEVRFWNWYHFPADFTISQFVDKGIGGALIGVVIHFFLRRR